MILNDNIKLIRELSGKTQKEFAGLIKSNLSNVKTYETSDVKPKARVLAAICDFAGITQKDLEERRLTHKDLHFGVDKVETNGRADPRDTPLAGAHVTLQDHIDLLKDYNEKLFALLSSNLGSLQEGQRIMIAYQKAWVDHAAEQESAGDPDRKEEIKYRFGKLVDDILHRGSLSGSQTGSGKRGKG